MDVLIKRVNNNKLETGVYRKPTSSDICINWNAHTTTQFKIGTLRNLIKRAKLICSDEGLVKEGMKYATKVFHQCLLEMPLYNKSLMTVKVKKKRSRN